MGEKYNGIYQSFLSILLRLIPLIGAVCFKAIDMVFHIEKVNYDATMYILSNVFVWIMLISIINKTLLKYYLVGFYDSQYLISRKLNSGKFVKVLIGVAAFINYKFFVDGLVDPYLMAAELILLVIADAAIEVKIRVYLQQEDILLDLEKQYS